MISPPLLEPQVTTDSRGNYQLIPDGARGYQGQLELQVEAGQQGGGEDRWRSDFVDPGLVPRQEERQIGFCEALLSHPLFQTLEALLICANAAVIGLETDFIISEDVSTVVENGFLCVFIAELVFKIIAVGIMRYFDWENEEFAWNMFDCGVVGVGIFDAVSAELAGDDKKGSAGFATIFRMVRLLRILRIFRIIKFLKHLYVLAFGLVESVKAVLWVTVLMFFVLYVCAIVLVKTMGSTEDSDSNHAFLDLRYGNMVDAMLTLFVLMSSPNFYIYQDEEGLLRGHPAFCIFLIFFITFGSFGMIALLTGVISESMFEKNEVRKEQNRIEQEEMKRSISERCKALFDSVPQEEGEAKVADVQKVVPAVCALLANVGIQFSISDCERLVHFMDGDGTGHIGVHEFEQTIIKVADGVGPMSIQEIHNRVGIVERKVDHLADGMNSGMTSLDGKMEAMQRQLSELTQVCSTLSKTIEAKGKGRW